MPDDQQVNGAMANDQAAKLRQKIHAGVRKAIAQAIEGHRKAGRSIVVWRDGKIVVIPPEEIMPLDERG